MLSETVDSDDSDYTRCADTDGDGCDDCLQGSLDDHNDGTDIDEDGHCDETDPRVDVDDDGVCNGTDGNASCEVPDVDEDDANWK
jgi:hypothetical protein